jgi:hypothetical protein
METTVGHRIGGQVAQHTRILNRPPVSLHASDGRIGVSRWYGREGNMREKRLGSLLPVFSTGFSDG